MLSTSCLFYCSDFRDESNRIFVLRVFFSDNFRLFQNPKLFTVKSRFWPLKQRRFPKLIFSIERNLRIGTVFSRKVISQMLSSNFFESYNFSPNQIGQSHYTGRFLTTIVSIKTMITDLAG